MNLEAELERVNNAFESLLAEVKKTCGQNNCNCPRAPIIKTMAEAL